MAEVAVSSLAHHAPSLILQTLKIHEDCCSCQHMITLVSQQHIQIEYHQTGGEESVPTASLLHMI